MSEKEVLVLYPHFSSLLNRYYLPQSKIVLGLSGGVDSRVLLHLLSLYRQEYPHTDCLVVHVHHGLSPNADDWAVLCQQWSLSGSVDYVAEKVTLERSNGRSIEEEARIKRYQVFETYMQPGDLLLTGQHLSDQTETFLLALKRGSGPKGLSSMPEYAAFGSGRVLRPLLSVSRDAIIRYAQQHRLEWVEDESNQDIRYDRNFLRHCIVPQLTGRWPEIERAVARSAALCAEQEALLQELLSDSLDSMVAPDGGLNIQAVQAQTALARNQLIRMWLERCSSRMPSRKQLALIWQEVACAQGDANPRLQLAQGEIRRYRGCLYFIDKYRDISHWRAELSVNCPVRLPDGLGSVVLTDNITGKGLCLRRAKAEENIWIGFNPEGLMAHPEQRTHSRKLKKLFQEYGIPGWQRRRLPLIMYGERLAMVAGLFTDREFSGDAVEVIWE